VGLAGYHSPTALFDDHSAEGADVCEMGLMASIIWPTSSACQAKAAAHY
jgi:hypothetical protein